MKSKLIMVVLVLAVAVTAQANYVPNGDFQTIHYPGDPTNGAYIQDGEYFNIPGQSMNGGALATYDVGEPGPGIELPGWVQEGEKSTNRYHSAPF